MVEEEKGVSLRNVEERRMCGRKCPARGIVAASFANLGHCMIGFPEAVWVSEREWPDGSSVPRPGHLELFAPQGFGLGAPAIVTPYGGAPPGDAYGFDRRHGNPLLDAPLSESAGGTLYFDERTPADSVRTAIDVMGVYDTMDYVAYAGSSADSIAERYLDQMRLVTHMALGSLFGASLDAQPAAQSVRVIDCVLAFAEAQKVKWNEARPGYSASLAGKAGGDGDWAKEALAFGFHVENTYWGVYRVWSRAWLVTK